MKIARFRLHGADHIQEYHEHMDDDNDWIRLTEVVEVDFIDLPKEVIVPAQVAYIDIKIKEARAGFGRALAKLEEEKSKLLALTHEPGEQQ